MNEAQIRQLLGVAVAYDNRKPSNANITAWWEAAERGRWTFEAAVEAVHQHYATSTDFLMPGHVTAAIKAGRQLPERYTPALDRPAQADPERVRGIVEQVAAKLGWRRQGQQSLTDPALDVECPHCHAGPRARCARMATRGPHRGEYVPLRAPHPSRVELAAVTGQRVREGTRREADQ